jgi:hypothetical protein
MGRTDAFRTVIVPAVPGLAPGDLAAARITRATTATLFGTLEAEGPDAGPAD